MITQTHSHLGRMIGDKDTGGGEIGEAGIRGRVTPKRSMKVLRDMRQE